MTMKVRYTTVNGQVIAEQRDGIRKQYIGDAVGSTVAIVASVENKPTITDAFYYWPYGEVASRVGSTPTPFQYVGTLGYYTDSTGLNYVRERFFSTHTGRWMTQDPIGFNGGSSSLYRYSSSNPITWTDPSGLATFIIDPVPNHNGVSSSYKIMLPDGLNPQVVATDFAQRVCGCSNPGGMAANITYDENRSAPNQKYNFKTRKDYNSNTQQGYKLGGNFLWGAEMCAAGADLSLILFSGWGQSRIRGAGAHSPEEQQALVDGCNWGKQNAIGGAKNCLHGKTAFSSYLSTMAFRYGSDGLIDVRHTLKSGPLPKYIF